jgi:hypothetical protein
VPSFEYLGITILENATPANENVAIAEAPGIVEQWNIVEDASEAWLRTSRFNFISEHGRDPETLSLPRPHFVSFRERVREQFVVATVFDAPRISGTHEIFSVEFVEVAAGWRCIARLTLAGGAWSEEKFVGRDTIEALGEAGQQRAFLAAVRYARKRAFEEALAWLQGIYRQSLRVEVELPRVTVTGWAYNHTMTATEVIARRARVTPYTLSNPHLETAPAPPSGDGSDPAALVGAFLRSHTIGGLQPLAPPDPSSEGPPASP